MSNEYAIVEGAIDMVKLWQLFRKRNQKAQNIWDLWSSIHEACYYYAIPNRNRFWRPKAQQGEFKNTRIYDTTAVEATKIFVSTLHDAMTPPQVQWGYLEIDQVFNTLEDVERNSIQEVADTYMRQLFVYLHQSNFDVVINECYFDLSIGTAALIVNSYTHKNPLLFSSVPMDKLCIEEALTGRIESWYRYWEEVKISEIKVRWPKAVIPPMYLDMLIDNPDAIIRKLYEGVMYMPMEEKPYCYMMGTEEEPMFCEYFDSNPGIVWRFQKVNSEVYGRGPVMDALPSIISLNELARIELAAANLNTFKPYMGFSDAVFNPHTFKLEPFTIIPIAPIGVGGSPPLVPLPDSSAPQFSQLTIQDLRMQVKTLLFNEVNMNQSVQPQTATEAMIAQQQLAKRIGPLFSRLQQEFLAPVIERCSYILDKMGILPIPDYKGVKINFTYRSPLALAKGEQDIARFTRYFQLMQGVLGASPATMYINPGVMPYLIAEQMQVDARYLNTPDQVAAAAQTAQNMQDEAAQNQQDQGQGQQQPPEGVPGQ